MSNYQLRWGNQFVLKHSLAPLSRTVGPMEVLWGFRWTFLETETHHFGLTAVIRLGTSLNDLTRTKEWRESDVFQPDFKKREEECFPTRLP